MVPDRKLFIPKNSFLLLLLLLLASEWWCCSCYRRCCCCYPILIGGCCSCLSCCCCNSPPLGVVAVDAVAVLKVISKILQTFSLSDSTIYKIKKIEVRKSGIIFLWHFQSDIVLKRISPDLVVMGGDSCSWGCEFESQYHILDGSFSHLFVENKFLLMFKRPKINKKRTGMAHFYLIKTYVPKLPMN